VYVTFKGLTQQPLHVPDFLPPVCSCVAV